MKKAAEMAEKREKKVFFSFWVEAKKFSALIYFDNKQPQGEQEDK
jgi:hypothetical protein